MPAPLRPNLNSNTRVCLKPLAKKKAASHANSNTRVVKEEASSV